MDPPLQSAYNEAFAPNNDLFFDHQSDWVNRLTNRTTPQADRDDSVAAGSYAGGQVEGPFPLWHVMSEPGTGFEQTATVTNASWPVLTDPCVRSDSAFDQECIEGSGAIMHNSESLWAPASWDLGTDYQTIDRDALGTSQIYDGAPRSNSFPDTSSKGDVDFSHPEGFEDIHDPPTFDRLTSEMDEDPETAIGTALKNGTFKCNMVHCTDRSFKRPAELRRHYNTTHAVEKPEYWCEVQQCGRSVAASGHPFHRKYRLQDHVRKIHGRAIEMSGDNDEAEE